MILAYLYDVQVTFLHEQPLLNRSWWFVVQWCLPHLLFVVFIPRSAVWASSDSLGASKNQVCQCDRRNPTWPYQKTLYRVANKKYFWYHTKDETKICPCRMGMVLVVLITALSKVSQCQKQLMHVREVVQVRRSVGWYPSNCVESQSSILCRGPLSGVYTLPWSCRKRCSRATVMKQQNMIMPSLRMAPFDYRYDCRQWVAM